MERIFFAICENDMHRNGNLGFKMGSFPRHIPNMQYIRSARPPPPPPGVDQFVAERLLVPLMLIRKRISEVFGKGENAQCLIWQP